jgi:hypothetical protein
MEIWNLGNDIISLYWLDFWLTCESKRKSFRLMRDQSAQDGITPTFSCAPDWTKIPMASENRASMVAYYSVLIPDARLPLMRARVVDGSSSHYR